ncbi:hypothetical protein KW784_01905 [Candidatus Parcubacteria bacterium]|nr:hypothetical protein [Candidatus Parcubacteria bacterium]
MSDTSPNYSKIASAIYLITGFFADQEPLKWRLRSLSADLVAEGGKDKAAVSREISSLFGIARTANLISEANHDILARELARMDADQDISFNLLLQSEDRRFPAPAMPRELAPRPTVIKDNIPESKTEEKPALREFGAVSVKKNSRQSIIIGLLKRKKEVMIKDVSPLITGCSEKTIQRELSDMVSEGILRKLGEKRWTRYTLA